MDIHDQEITGLAERFRGLRILEGARGFSSGVDGGLFLIRVRLLFLFEIRELLCDIALGECRELVGQFAGS